MEKINIYDKEDFNKCKSVCFSLKKVTDKKLERTLNKNLCFWCEERTAKFPKISTIEKFNIIPKQAIFCESCFVKPIEDEFKIIEKFGSGNICFISEEKREKNKLLAKKYLEDIDKNKIRFCDEHELLILNIIKSFGEFCKFFEDN